MNSLIDEISSYPFERLRNLIIPTKNKNEINLSIGEPKHQANPRVLEEINNHKNLFSHYPPMAMIPELKKGYKNLQTGWGRAWILFVYFPWWSTNRPVLAAIRSWWAMW